MSTAQPDEIQHFSAHADRWWDLHGPHAPLHKMNPLRLRYICDAFGGSVADLKILDIGCGGGLACEPLARLGAKITGADADPVAIDVAQAHAKDSGLKITYKNEAAEDMKGAYDCVLALEIMEHVTDPQAFLCECARLTKTGGLVIASTLNRTAKSYAMGIVAAEHILKLVPKGTHEWSKFIKPSELAGYGRAAGLQAVDVQGMVYRPLQDDFVLDGQKLAVNYIMALRKI